MARDSKAHALEVPDPRKVDWPLPQDADAELDRPDPLIATAAEGIQRSLAALPESAATGFIEIFSRALEQSPAPGESALMLERLFQHHPADVPEFVRLSIARPQAFTRMFVLCGHSRPLAGHLVSGAWRAHMALSDEELSATVTRATVLQAILGAECGDVATALRRSHRDLCLRVLWHEVAMGRPLEVIGSEISALADGAIEYALRHAAATLAAERGLNAPAGFRFCVMAMGKLGAEELNYSSDIDLVFLYDGEYGPDGPRMGALGYAVKLAEATIKLLDDVTEDGRVFRVDTRLRPEGRRGRLARSLQSTVEYYHSFGTTLERQALIKARPCAGNLELGNELLERVAGWVYRKYLSAEEIGQIQDLKRHIEKRTDDRAETFADIKTGFGGIRDIEFVTQFLQLLNAGRMPELRERATLAALKALAIHGVMKPAEADELAESYRFLRNVEHRLQLWEAAQTHTLPDTPAELGRVARAMGYGPRDAARALMRELRLHAMKSRGLMVRLFAGLFRAHESPAEPELVLDPDLSLERATEILRPYGFTDPAQAFRLVRELAEESAENRLYAPRARKYLASMMPALLAFCAQSAEPDNTLLNFERICANLGAKTMLFELVAEDPRALRIFGSIAAHSRWLTDTLARRPGLVDEFIDGLQTFAALDRARLEHELRQRVAAGEGFMDALFWQRDVEMLRIGLFDVTGRTPLPNTLHELCVLAEVLLGAVTEHALQDELAREVDGRPASAMFTTDPRELLAVVALGKLGAGGMNYASDLDLVFVIDAAPEDTALQAFFARVVRRVLDLLTSTGERGRLYEVDLRLRPRGRAGNLATTLHEFEKYLAADAGYWERIAATRARVLSTGAAGRKTASMLQRFVYEAPADAAQMLAMRQRLERESASSVLKRGRGGTLDIEFMLAHVQMAQGARHDALREPNLWLALHAARQSGLLDEREYDQALGAYAFLRQVVNRLQIYDGVSTHDLPQGEALEVFARRMGYAGDAAAQLTEELDWHRSNARALYERVLGNVGA
jgi:glutamate-ammonia-ligase adenylyltransferase